MTISDIFLSQSEKDMIDMVYSCVEIVAKHTAESFIKSNYDSSDFDENSLIGLYDRFKKTYINNATVRILKMLEKTPDNDERNEYLNKLKKIAEKYYTLK